MKIIFLFDQTNKDLRIEIDKNEIIALSDFELSWRWEKSHNSIISDFEKDQIIPVSEMESKRLNKVIDFFELEDDLSKKFINHDWIRATSDHEDNIALFRKKITSILEPWTENVLITWNRGTTLKTTKELFLKYWDDFCYPSSDDVTIISEETNWVMFYNHVEMAKIWTLKNPGIT
ncbi:hypothetical protein [Brumimicrobium mesophilum]|uniref:hypothetical protein n=1 Tax=Brumimicrobium mesophilum TaxID=392717 RepID=UPI000D141F50|nr:hypothetical protein [Brumimicrobium mesophilum]